jgi:CDP-glycerol glycerophosphotransferase
MKTRVTQATRTAVMAVGKRIPVLLTAARATVAVTKGLRWRRAWTSNPVDPDLAVFQCYGGRGYTCSPRAMYRAMLADPRFENVEKVWALRPPMAAALLRRGGYDVRGFAEGAHIPAGPYELEATFGADALEELRHAVIVPWGSPECDRVYARAGLWVTNSILPTYLTPREGQTYLQTWHGTPLKRLGCDIQPGASGNAVFTARDIHRRYKREGARLTYFVSPSVYATERFASAFNLAPTGRTEAILEEGYPRNDFLATYTPADADAIRARLGVPAGKKVVLYAPTWRDNQHTSGVGFTGNEAADFALLRAELGDDYVILYRAHYLIANSFDFSAHDGFVVDVSGTADVNDLYVVSDVLVTDYSSVFFDYANLRRPIVFFMHDLNEYAGELRGFYIGIDELPGPVVSDSAALVDAVRASEQTSDGERDRLETFRERFAPMDDGHASERVLDRVRSGRRGR